jgi:hypothetical protein
MTRVHPPPKPVQDQRGGAMRAASVATSPKFEVDWEQARMSRNALPFEKGVVAGASGRLSAPPTLSVASQSQVREARPEDPSKLRLKSLDRVAQMQQQHADEVQGPSTPPGYPPATKALKESGISLMRAKTVDLKEYSETQIDRSGAPPVLNFGARRKVGEGHEAPSERPHSREEMRELRNARTGSIDLVGRHHEEPSNVAFAARPRPPAEPFERRNDETVCGYGVDYSQLAPKDETTLFYETVLKQSKLPEWQHLKPPTMPLYRKPETKSRQRKDVWMVIPTNQGDLYVVSNKATTAKPGEYEPSLDPTDSQWAASQLALGPRAGKPWAFEEGEGGVSETLTRKPTIEELDREMALKTFKISRSSVISGEPLHEFSRSRNESAPSRTSTFQSSSPTFQEAVERSEGEGLQKLAKLSMKDIRRAGCLGGSDVKPRGSTAQSFDERAFSLGLKGQLQKKEDWENLLAKYPGRMASQFPAGAMLSGNLYHDGNLSAKVDTMEHNKTGMPAGINVSNLHSIKFSNVC